MTDGDALDALCALVDPTRRRLYEHVVGHGPVTRDSAAEALGIDRSLAAYHLDKLADQGLLAVRFARPPGRGGPGAGRPAKHYERSGEDFAVTVPPRNYALAAELLARAAAVDASGVVRAVLDDAARALGRDLAAGADDDAARDLVDFLDRLGYEPYRDAEDVRLANCPFRQLAQQHTELVCGMNVALMEGVVAAVDDRFAPRLDPAPGRCCVAFRRRAAAQT